MIFQPDTEKELEATFQAVRYNLEVICRELKAIDYLFLEEPLQAPREDVTVLLAELKTAIGPDKYLPLSLEYFYRIVGAVNFGWDYYTNEYPLWEMADPLQIAGLDVVAEEVEGELDDDFYLELSADVYHKDNISGGPAYGIPLLEAPGIDAPFLEEPHQTSFINYLRKCCEHCGFPGIDLENMDESFSVFYHKVKPQLREF